MKRKLLFLSLAALVLFQPVFAQRTITGTVTSAEDDQPIVGANVLEEGTINGATTDVDGKYSLTVSDSAKNLVFTFVGLKKQTLPIDKNEISVVMEADENVFDDVVITAIAIEREKSSLGYATTTVENAELTAIASSSPIEALKGKVAGASITTSNGSPGASTRIVLRGGTSILGDNQALLVVDGLPIDNSNFGSGDDFNGEADELNNNFDVGNRGNDLNPNDIESITVLKGPAAAALYGSKGANGALIITTKRGRDVSKSGKPFLVSYGSDFTFSNILKLPEYQNEYGQGGEKFPDSRENFSWGPKFDGVVRPWGQVVGGQQKVKPYSALPNNVKEFFELGTKFNNNISFEGETKNTGYYLSYNNIKQEGVIPTEGYKRNSLRFNLSHTFSEKLRSEASLFYAKTHIDWTVQGQGNYSTYDQVIQTPRDISLLELEDLSDPFNQPETYYGAYTLNPWYVLDVQDNDNDVDRFNAIASVTYSPVKWLNIMGRFGSDIYTDTRVQRLAKFSFENQTFPYEEDGKYSEDIYRVNSYNTDLIISANHTFDNGFTIGGLVGNNIFTKKIQNTFASTAGLNIEGYYNLENSAGRPVTKNLLSERRTAGVYGELDFDYKDYVFLTFTARNDWASTLPEDNNSYFYPGINAAFVFTKLVDINPKILSYGKVRGGWAKVGSGGEAPYLLTNVYVQNSIGDGFNESEVNPPYPSGAGDAVGVDAYTVSNTLRNPNLKPEFTTSWEIGTELGFWNDRLTVDFTYYMSESKDLILTTAPVAPSSGYTAQVINAGTMENKGFELEASIIPVHTSFGLKWEVYGTFTKNTNEVTALPDGVDQIVLGGFSDMSIVARKGEPYGSFYAVSNQRDPQGRVVVDSVSGQPLLDDQPRIFGSYQPDWMGSIGTTLSWKGLKFNILFDTRQGGMVYSRTMDTQEFVGTSPNTLNNDREDFIVPNSVIQTESGDYVENTSVLAHHQDYWTVYNNQDHAAHLLPASFTKLRELSLTYTFPSKWLKKTKFIAGAEIKVFGSNLALWVPDENTFIDPETSSYGAGNAQGFEFGTTPSLRNFGFGFNLDFN